MGRLHSGCRRFSGAVAALVGLAMAMIVVTGSGSVSAATTSDGRYEAMGSVAAGGVLDIAVLGRGGVPDAGVAAVAVTVTVTEPTAAGYVTVWPSGGPPPGASSVNFVAGQTIANSVVVAPGVGGRISLYNSAGTTHVVVDVLGWFAADGGIRPVTPARLADTRPGSPTADSLSMGGGALVAGDVRTVAIAGRGGVPQAGVGSVVLNVTAVDPSTSSFFTVWPAGQDRPTSSNLNVTTGGTIANMVIVPLGHDGAVNVFNFAGSADLVIDVLAWFPAGSGAIGLTPARLLDTRPGAPTVDGHESGDGPLRAGQVRNVTVVDRGGIPGANVTAVAVNVTVNNPSTDGFLTVWPSGTSRRRYAKNCARGMRC